MSKAILRIMVMFPTDLHVDTVLHVSEFPMEFA